MGLERDLLCPITKSCLVAMRTPETGSMLAQECRWNPVSLTSWPMPIGTHERFERPFDMPDSLLEEAEASIHGSFCVALEPSQRKLLIEDAPDQLDRWLLERRS